MKNWSFKTKLMSFIVGVNVLFALVSIGLVEYMAEKRKSALNDTLGALTKELQHGIASQFFERYGDVQAFSKNVALYGDDQMLMTTVFNEYIKLYQIYDLIVFVDPTGKLIASSNVDPNGNPIKVEPIRTFDYTTTAWFKNVALGKFTEDRSKGFTGTFVEDPHLDKLTSQVYGDKRLGNSFSSVVKNLEGKTIGYISLRANFKWVEYEYETLYRDLKAQGLEKTEMTLINSDGMVLIDYDPSVTNSDKITHDFDASVLKTNLYDLNYEPAVLLKEGKSGTLLTKHSNKDQMQITSYTTLDHPKFIKSLGWGLLTRFDQASSYSEINKTFHLALVILALLTTISLLCAWFLTRKLSGNLNQIVNDLEVQVQHLNTAYKQLNTSSQTLSESCTEQAAAVQESMAATQEIGSMIRSTVQFAEESQAIASTVKDNSVMGCQNMEEMDKSMQSIQAINDQVNKIGNIINDISMKTNVINDIVFKTQLLSFNASIEAARAGQHGKGFAVVAEEVGNLAEMSGNAAKDISTLLESSKQEVQNIIKSTEEKVSLGRIVSQKAISSFDSIAKDVNVVSQKISEIVHAAKEQENGINQTSTSISQMSTASRQNANVATDASRVSKDIGKQSHQLAGLIGKLNEIVFGEGSIKRTINFESNVRVENSHEPKIRRMDDFMNSEVDSIQDLNSEVTADHPSFKKAA